MLHPRSDWLQAEATTWPGGTTTAYDALDRAIAVTAPNGVTTKTAYNADRSGYTFVDAQFAADRMLRWTRQDGLGNTDAVATFNQVNGSWVWNASVLLAYDLTGNLTQVRTSPKARQPTRSRK